MKKNEINDEALFELLFSERAKMVVENKMPNLKEKLEDREVMKIAIQNVKILMAIHGIWTIQELAKRVSIDRAQMSKILEHKSIMTVQKFCSLARALTINPFQLINLNLEQIVKDVLKAH